MRWSAGLGLALVLSGCAAWRDRPGTAALLGHVYADDQGLTVVTAGVEAEQPVSGEVSVVLTGLVDRITVVQPDAIAQDTGGQLTGHAHVGVDSITSASVTVTGGERLEKTRFEGTAGAAYDTGALRIEGTARVSSEPDFASYSGRLEATAELFERNTTLAAFAHAGHDEISPIAPPPGEEALWPASQDRISGGASLSQLLGPRLIASGGFALTRQSGTLSSPYRRALVKTSLFPEALPRERLRASGYAALSWYLGAGTALHLRQGLYADSWEVLALIPEVEVAVDVAQAATIALGYRFYAQTAASFYQARYDALLPTRTGDARLGPLTAHQPQLRARWAPLEWLELSASYELPLVRHAEIGRTVIGHVGSVGVAASY